MILSKRRVRAVKQAVYPLLVALTEGTNILLDKPVLLIGRHQECDIQIPSRKISRRHCCIALLSDHLVIRDLGSTNGIRINGIKVVEGNLQANDELTIGNVRYQVKWSADEAQPLPAPKQAIKPGKPPHQPALDESADEPMPLSEATQAPPKPGSMEIPDDIGLAPLDPPKPS